MGITRPQRAQAAAAPPLLLVEESPPQGTACRLPRWPCRGWHGRARGAAPGQAVPPRVPAHGRAGAAAAAPPAPASPELPQREGNRNAKCHLLSQRRRGSAPTSVLSEEGRDPEQCLPPIDFKSGCFLVKTFTAAAWQRLLLLLTKQRGDFSREATASEFVKLLSPALKPERGVEINICIFVLLPPFSNGASPAKDGPFCAPRCLLVG